MSTMKQPGGTEPSPGLESKHIPDLYRLESYHFDLPAHLIAQYPPEERGTSRLMAVNRRDGIIRDGHFPDIIDFLEAGDTLVLNKTRVMPARLLGRKDSGGQVELFLLEAENNAADRWRALVRPAKRLKPGHRIKFPGCEGACAWIDEVLPEPGMRIVRFEGTGNVYDFMDKAGHVPLPPYIDRADEQLDRERYQTVFAENRGSVAAPTAGLHFTAQMLDALKQKGVAIEYVLLHVGLGTFRPVHSHDIREHRMHAEYYEMTTATATALNSARNCGGRLIAVGSTAMRTLETICDEEGMFKAGSGKTSCFIYPGYKFKAADGLLTNFHLPGSSLMMLVAAFAGYDIIMQAYRHAVESGYRFFSYGDAMLIL